MRTYQDLLKAPDLPAFVQTVIADHQQSELYKTAVDADQYDRQRNVTIKTFTNILRQRKRLDARRELKIPCNLLHRVCKQRCGYLLGNGVTFGRKERRVNDDGRPVTVDLTREAMGPTFDTDIYNWGYKALLHGVAFEYVTPERLYLFPVTQFAPLYDEDDGAMRAGVRFWRLAADRPMVAELYTESGVTTYRAQSSGGQLQPIDEKPYLVKVKRTEARGVIGIETVETNYLPIVPMYGGSTRQSMLVGMRDRIDAIDMVQSGFARDVRDCAKIYWLIANHGGMSDADLDKFLDDINDYHIAKVHDSTAFTGESLRNALTPYAQDVPYEANVAFLNYSRAALFEDAGALDVHSISASSTNDHIDAAYQPLDQEADDFEAEVIPAIQQVLRLRGIDDTPAFKRNRIANVKEQTETVMLVANLLGRRKALEKLPILTTDEVDEIEADEFAAGLGRQTQTEL